MFSLAMCDQFSLRWLERPPIWGSVPLLLTFGASFEVLLAEEVICVSYRGFYSGALSTVALLFGVLLCCLVGFARFRVDTAIRNAHSFLAFPMIWSLC